MPTRNDSIDILRSIAVLLVIGRHMQVQIPSANATAGSRFVCSLSEAWQRGGWVGVDLFFVLSGFLVSGLLLTEYKKLGSVSATRFLIRRGFKIYPAFWVLIGSTVLGSWFAFGEKNLTGLLSELCFLQNYFPGLWNHTWSLAIEEHFYLLLALLLGTLARGGPLKKGADPFKSLPTIFMVVASFLLGLRVLTHADDHNYSHYRNLFPTHLRIDSLFFGVVLAYGVHFRGMDLFLQKQKRKWPLLLVGMLLLLPAFLFTLEESPWIYTFGFTAFYIGSGLLLLGVLQLNQTSVSAPGRLLAFVGQHSYSIYLWHMPILMYLIPLLKPLYLRRFGSLTYIVLCLTLSVTLGILASKIIEIPVIRFRDKVFPSRANPLGQR